jgi:hypothetical protein
MNMCSRTLRSVDCYKLDRRFRGAVSNTTIMMIAVSASETRHIVVTCKFTDVSEVFTASIVRAMMQYTLVLRP